jgi:hypothetical protein
MRTIFATRHVPANSPECADKPLVSGSPPNAYLAGATLSCRGAQAPSTSSPAYWYLHAVDGRDAETASALSELAARSDAAKLPRSIVVKH